MTQITRAGDNYTYITSGATTQVFIGAGILVAVMVNKPLTGTVKLIDNTGGSTANIATLASGKSTGSVTQIGRIEYNLTCSTGLIVINSATEDITIIWRQG